MNKTFTKLLVGIFFTAQVATYAQTEPCATDQFHNRLLLNNPQYAQRFSENNQKIANYIQNSNNIAYRTIDANTTYTIPVVFHVIHTGGAVGTIYNPSDANINAMLAKLNSDWANQGFVDMKIQFALAQRSPGCGSTTGINRINGSGVAGYTASGVNSSNTNGADEVAVKDLIRWDHDNYINIWIVNKIDGADGTSGQFTAGYAYFPGAGADVDGVIMLATQTNGGDITLTHEIGHFFNLYHTFQGDGSGSTCPSDADCGTNGDCISDTPPHMRSPFNCPTGTTCSGASGLQVPYNFMDYSNCQDRFTAGQKTRARAALATLRPGLMSSLGCVAPTGTVMTASGTVTSSNPTNTNYMGPVSVSFNGNEMVSGAYSSDDIALVDYSCTQQYSVTAGNAYSLDVKTQTNPQKVFVYIDYNNNGSFTDAGETVYSHTGSTATETHSTTITIPSSGVTTGVPLRMRVWADWYGTGGFTGPTGSIGYGQAEDYAIIVTGGACASVTASISSFTNVTCNGGSNGAVTASASGGSGFTYSWSNGATTASITGLPAGTYTCTVTNSCGNSNSVSRTITQPAAVTVTVTGTNSICSGSSTTLTASGVTSYSWSSGQTTAAITVSPSTTTTYSVTGTNASGCTGTSSRTVTVNTIPSITGTTPGSRCGTGTVTLSATSSAGTLGWYAAATGGTALSSASSYTTPSIASTTTYYVSATNGSCTSARTSVTATINANPTVSASASPATITAGQSSVVSATGAISYSWNTSETTSSITVSPSSTTTYSVVGIGSNGCSATASAMVSVTSASGVPTTQLRTDFCGATLATATSTFYCDAVTGGVSDYQYEFTDMATSVVTVRNRGSYANTMTLNIGGTGLAVNGKTYSVRVRACVGGVWGSYGSVCTLSTPAYTGVPTTQLRTDFCGATLATATSTFYCDAVTGGVSDYQYEFTDMATSVVTVRNRGSYANTMTLNIGGTGLAVNGKTYSVRVRACVGGVWGSYGSACTLSTPAYTGVPTTQLRTDFCGATLATATSTFYCDAVTGGVSDYQYEFTDMATSVVTVRNRGSYANTMTLSFGGSGLAVNDKTYSVRVRAYVGGVWGSFGAACLLSTPSSARLSNPDLTNTDNALYLNNEAVSLQAYPNPSNGTLTIQSNRGGIYVVMNELGQTVQTFVLSNENDNSYLINGLNAGIYVVISNQPEGTLSRKIIITK